MLFRQIFSVFTILILYRLNIICSIYYTPGVIALITSFTTPYKGLFRHSYCNGGSITL